MPLAEVFGPDVLIVVLVLLVWLAAYFAPTIVGSLRNIEGLGRVVFLNLVLGWTVIGWVVALVLAIRQPQRLPRTG